MKTTKTEALAAPVQLTGKQRTLLAQAWAMLEDYAEDQRSRGNDSFANGADASAHEIKTMLTTQPAAQPAPVQEPVSTKIAAQLRAMACNYPAGHLWDKLDAKACLEGALLLEGRHPKAPPAQPAVPEGWKLVPVEPTDEMLDAAQSRVDDMFRVDAMKAYEAMIAAAPMEGGAA